VGRKGGCLRWRMEGSDERRSWARAPGALAGRLGLVPVGWDQSSRPAGVRTTRRGRRVEAEQRVMF
jgi:hypothetical protein